MMRRNRALYIRAGVASALTLALFTGLTACGRNAGDSEEAEMGEMPPPAVQVTTVTVEKVSYRQEYPGRVRGSREVEVRARVGGILEERLYREGQRVEQGDALFRIDPEIYRITLTQAEAEMANAQANFNRAEREERRVSRLYESNAVSERERDNAASDRELAEAQLKLLEARIAEARLNLDYTNVEAPLTGVTGLEVLSEGSLVQVGTLLTTIVQQDPVHIRFALPERDAALKRRAEGPESTREVRLTLPDGSEYGEVGTVDFTDSIIDPRTGTVSIRAVFPNPENALLPGQFVRIKVVLEEFEDAVLIRQEAVVNGGQGTAIFVLNEDNTVEARPVRIGPVIEGRQLVLEGLEAGERIVTNGQVSLADGMPVQVIPNEEEGE